jgi:hypothetical protein
MILTIPVLGYQPMAIDPQPKENIICAEPAFLSHLPKTKVGRNVTTWGTKHISVTTAISIITNQMISLL